MNRRIFSWAVVLIFVVTVILASVSFGKEPAEKVGPKPISKEDIFDELELFADAITQINTNYVQETNSKELIYGALDGMLSSLDSYSSFLTPDEFKEIQTETMGEFGGIGIKVTLKDKVVTVISPLEGTPAEKAGIMPGDKIVKINDESTKDFTMDDVVKKLRGLPGAKVKITVLREGEEKLKEFIIRRSIIVIKSVTATLILEDNIGYIRLVEFQQHTAQDIEKAIRCLLKEGMSSLILDVRNNPGGLLDVAVMVSEKFLKKENMIVSVKGRISQQDKSFKSKAYKPYLDFPIVVLINKGSASASEILAAALRDNKRAVIVGENSFGKGSVQTVIPMKDGSALRLTTALFYTPSGKVIYNNGIVPDIEVKGTKLKDAGDEEEGMQKQKEKSLLKRLKEDNQVLQAMAILKDKGRYNAVIER